MSSKKWVLIGSSAWVALCGTGARGDVTITSRYSETTAVAKAFGVTAFGEPDGPLVTRTSTSTDFNPFNAQKLAQSDTVQFTTTSSSAFQDSSLNVLGAALISAQASGDTSASVSTSIGQGSTSG